MIKRFLFIALSCPCTLSAQFVTGSEGLTVKAGTILSVDELVLQPSADFTLSSNSLTHSATRVQIGNDSSIQRVYTFMTPVSFSGTAGFYYQDTELGSNAEAGLNIVTAATATGNVWITTNGSVVNIADNYIRQVFSGSTLARITASSSTTPLPVTLVSFTAQKSELARAALLRWDVMDELNMAGYEVERSTDSKTFTGIGKVAAAAKKTKKTYTLTDYQPATGTNYYRLRLLEQNGGYRYSAVRPLFFGDETGILFAMPNPFVSEITIHSNDALLAGTAGFVSDATGREILSFRLEGESTTLNASGWASGIYIIRLADGRSFKLEKR